MPTLEANCDFGGLIDGVHAVLHALLSLIDSFVARVSRQAGTLVEIDRSHL